MNKLVSTASYIIAPMLGLVLFFFQEADSFVNSYKNFLYCLMVSVSIVLNMKSKLLNLDIINAALFSFVFSFYMLNAIMIPHIVIVVTFSFLLIWSIYNFYIKRIRSFDRFIHILALSSLTVLSTLFLSIFIVSSQFNLKYIEMNSTNLLDFATSRFDFDNVSFVDIYVNRYSDVIFEYVNYLMVFAFSIWVIGHICVIIFHRERAVK